MTPSIGTTSTGHVIPIDVERLIETRLLCTASSGSGKSWALRRLLEQTHGKVQQIVIDVEDEFATLREKFDYVLAGRQGGDCPADVRCAALLARRLLELRVSAIVGIYELKQHERVRFVRLFLEELVNSPKDLWHPVLVVIDEASYFAPESGKAESTQAVIDLMSRGRKRGFAGVLATQRPAMLAKDASAQAINKLVGRFSQDIDVKRAADDLGFYRREQQAELRKLTPGRFFAVGPAFCDAVTELMVGPVVTTHPRAGQRALAPPPPKESVKRVLATLANLPHEAEQEAQTVGDLKRRIRELESAAKVTASTPQQPDIKKIESQIRQKYETERLKWHAVAKRSSEIIAGIPAAVEKARTALDGSWLDLKPISVIEVAAQPDHAFKAPAFKAERVIPVESNGHSEIGQGGLRRMLIALAQRPQGLSTQQIGVRAKVSSKSGTFDTYLSRARASGWIEGSRAQLKITALGLEALGPFEPLPSGEQLREHWLRQLKGGAGRMLKALAEAYPDALSAEQVGERAVISSGSGTFDTYLSRLRSLELITGSRSELKASEELFS